MRTRIILTLLLPLLTACGVRASLTSATSTPFIITSTLPPTIVPSATLTPLPPSVTPTTTPVQGTTSNQVNERTSPSTAADSIRIIQPFVTIQIVGMDPDGSWYEIIDSQAPQGFGWVSSQYIIVAQNKDKIPVIGGTDTPTPSTGTPAAGSPESGVTGTVIQQVNVRNGPGTTFDPIGTLQPNDTVTLTGKNPGGDWFQIAYPSGPNGKGWVAASFIQASGTENLPIVGSSGNVIGTGTPVAARLLPTATPLPAYADQDSAQSPAADVALSTTGNQTLLYTSDLSAPQGDAQDWVRFTTSAPGLLASLSCTGNAALSPLLTLDGAAVPSDGLSCGTARQLLLSPGEPYLIQLSIAGGNSSLSYVRYTLELKAAP